MASKEIAVDSWRLDPQRGWLPFRRLLFASSPVVRQSIWLSVFASFAIGASVGLLSWGSFDALGWLAAILVLPVVWGRAGSRWRAGVVMLGYFLAGARGLPGGAAVFFGDASWWVGYLAWFAASVLLTVPYVLVWSSNAMRRAVGFAVAVLAGMVPPLGLIGWLSPMTVAGVLYPGLGWAGVLLTLVLLVLLAAGVVAWRWIGGLVAVALVVNVLAVTVWRPLEVPAGWAGIDTHFPRLGSGVDGSDNGVMLAGRQRVAWVNRFVEAVPANSVRVLPETVLGRYDGIAQFDLMDAGAELAARGSRVLVGAEVPIGDSGRYLNALVVLGAAGSDGAQAVQGVPVPVSMWKPWSGDGAVADVWGRGGRLSVGGLQAQVVICYEQALTWTMLKGMVERVDVLVGAANGWWAKDASIPAIQREMMRVYGRLFGVPVVMAGNL